MQVASEHAARVAVRVRKFDPTIFVVVLGVIVNAIRLWLECRKYHQSPREMASHAGPIVRLRIRMFARRALRAAGEDERLANEITRQTLAELAATTDEDVARLIREVESAS
jgi:hypothetical protein